VSRLLVGAWVAGLAAVIGVAILGSDTTPAPERFVRGEPTLDATTVDELAAGPDRGPRDPRSETTAALRHLVVRGRVARDVAEVRIMLTTAAGTPVSTARLDPIGHGRGGWVPFESRLPVMRRSAAVGDALFVVTVDGTGAPFDDTRHRYHSSIFLFVGAGGRASSTPDRPARVAPRGYPSSSAVSVFGHPRMATVPERP
jgi:hypothetical protein